MRETDYTYDTDYANPLTLPCPTRNNRLLSYAEQTDGVPTRAVAYSYYVNGDASNVTIRDVGDVDAQGRQVARDLALYYNRNGMLSLAYWGTWSESDGVFVPGTLAADTAREFRYDAARQRYASIPLTRISGTAAQPCFGRSPNLSASTWTDYVGDMPYTDFQADLDVNNHGVATTLTRQFLNAEQTAVGETRYFHDDLVGSAVLATGSTGAPIPTGTGVAKLAYTAFGEEIALVGGNGVGAAAMLTRYRYVGGYGYEADWLALDGKPGSAPVTLQHVGYRWYQASIGRFVQRDPAGLASGTFNLYVYCTNAPLALIDERGLWCTDPYPGEGFFQHPVTQGAGVVITIVGGVVVVAGAPVTGTVIGIVGTIAWGGGQVYTAVHTLCPPSPKRPLKTVIPMWGIPQNFPWPGRRDGGYVPPKVPDPPTPVPPQSWPPRHYHGGLD